MSGRRPRQPDNFRGHREGPPPMGHRGPGPLPPHPAALEEELELQRRDIQQILAENSHVVEENVILQRELIAVKDEIHRAEVVQLRGKAQKLNSLRQDLSTQVQTLTKDLNRVHAENEQVFIIKTNIDGLCTELLEMRRDYEMKKKANEEQMVRKEVMEKNLISMAREIEKLRAEQMTAERRSRGLGGGGYGMLSGSPEMRYQGSAYGDVYGSGGGWESYDHRGPPRR